MDTKDVETISPFQFFIRLRFLPNFISAVKKNNLSAPHSGKECGNLNSLQTASSAFVLEGAEEANELEDGKELE